VEVRDQPRVQHLDDPARLSPSRPHPFSRWDDLHGDVDRGIHVGIRND